MKPALIAIIAVAFSSPAFAEEAHRELGPHVHGHGTVNMAIEKNRVTMELVVPGMDIVGFEHAPSTPDQKATVEKATATLKNATALFVLPEGAGCKVTDAAVKIEPEQEDEHEAGDHDHEDHAGHNQFHTNYTLACARPESLSTIQFDYFKSFAGAQGLTVNVVTANAQNSYEVTRDKPTLDLGGVM